MEKTVQERFCPSAYNQSKYSEAINVAKLCCHWLKYLLKDKNFVHTGKKPTLEFQIRELLFYLVYIFCYFKREEATISSSFEITKCPV